MHPASLPPGTTGTAYVRETCGSAPKILTQRRPRARKRTRKPLTVSALMEQLHPVAPTQRGRLTPELLVGYLEFMRDATPKPSGLFVQIP